MINQKKGRRIRRRAEEEHLQAHCIQGSSDDRHGNIYLFLTPNYYFTNVRHIFVHKDIKFLFNAFQLCYSPQPDHGRLGQRLSSHAAIYVPLGTRDLSLCTW